MGGAGEMGCWGLGTRGDGWCSSELGGQFGTRPANVAPDGLS